MAANAERIIRLIEKNKVTHLQVGVYGDVTTEANQHVIRRALKIKERRGNKRPLEIGFFDAASAQVWG